MVLKPSRKLENVALLHKAHLMARAKVEKDIIDDFKKKIFERYHQKKKGFVDRPAVKKVTAGLNRTVGKVAGLALERGLGDRSEKIYRQIEPYIEEENDVLDLGCGDGKIGYILHLEKGCNVELMDVKDYNQTPLPLKIYNGTSIPGKDNSYDHVLLLTVLHHADNPMVLMKQALRLAEKSVIVIESVYFDRIPLHRKINAAIDLFSSRMLVDPEINVPFNFLTPTAWVAVFEEAGGKVVGMEKLGIDQPLVPEYHVLYEVEKQR